MNKKKVFKIIRNISIVLAIILAIGIIIFKNTIGVKFPN